MSNSQTRLFSSFPALQFTTYLMTVTDTALLLFTIFLRHSKATTQCRVQAHKKKKKNEWTVLDTGPGQGPKYLNQPR